MLDKFLCKHIHKKEITIGDIFDKYGVTVFWLIIAGFVISLVFGMLSVVLEVSLIEIIKEICKLVIVLICYCIAICLIAVLFVGVAIVFFRICSEIASIKVATCPNIKPESTEPSQDQSNEDRNPNCSFSNVCELGKTCTNCYNDCLKTNHEK